MLARHVSDLTGPSSGEFYKLYSQTLVCGNTRTTRHVQPLQRLDVSSSTHSSTTYQSLRIQLVKNAPEDRPVKSETCRANIRDE